MAVLPGGLSGVVARVAVFPTTSVLQYRPSPGEIVRSYCGRY